MSINGANRLGSNSLPECLVFGARAGRAAAEYASAAGSTPSVDRGAGGRRGAPPRARPPGQGAGRPRASPRSATRCRPTMEEAAGIYRTGPDDGQGRGRPRRAAGAHRERRPRGHQPVVQHRARRPPWSWPTCSTSPSASSQSGLQREESRGAHQRTDFPARDDERFLTHQLVHRNPDGTPRVERLPVTITRWPPGERVYGR